MSVESTVRPWPYAVVHLRNKDTERQLSIPAALVFDTPRGFAFLEPGYLDPHGAEHRFHRVECTFFGRRADEEPDELAFSGPEWEGHLARYVGGERSLDGYASLLRRERGRTVDEEWKYQRQHLAEDLS